MGPSNYFPASFNAEFHSDSTYYTRSLDIKKDPKSMEELFREVKRAKNNGHIVGDEFGDRAGIMLLEKVYFYAKRPFHFAKVKLTDMFDDCMGDLLVWLLMKMRGPYSAPPYG